MIPIDGAAGCAVYDNSVIRYSDVVRFDEEARAEALSGCVVIITVPGSCYDGSLYSSPAVSRVAVSDEYGVPPNPRGAPEGWIYFNFDDFGFEQQPAGDPAAQSWVVVSMEAEGRFSVDFDATSLGNGCSPPAYSTDEDRGQPAIGPAPNLNPSSVPIP